MKIDIIGSVASGKTTMAAQLSEKYGIPCFEKDNIVWERTESGDVRRPERQRDRLFAEILAGENWIVEGSPRACLNESFDVCDYIILLDVSTFVRLKRVFLRWIRQRTGRERCNTAPTLAFLLDNLKWVFEFNRKKKSLIEQLSEHGDRFRVFNSQEAAIHFIESRCAPEKEN